MIYGKRYFATTCVPSSTIEYGATISSGACTLPISKTLIFDNSPYELPDPCEFFPGMGAVYGNSTRTTWTATITQ
jgi:uncharacterized protein YpmS